VFAIIDLHSPLRTLFRRAARRAARPTLIVRELIRDAPWRSVACEYGSIDGKNSSKSRVS
jgi:hypothetical protein